MRVFLDANVLFSAARAPGAMRELLRRLRNAGHKPCMDEYVVEEARRNLAIKAPKHTSALQSLLREIKISPYRAASLDAKTAQLLPEKDRPVLSAAIGLGCDVLVTGDRKHFGMLYGTRIENVTVCSPAELARMLGL